VAVSADDRTVYVTCETSNSIYVVEAASLKVLAQIPTGKRPRAIYLSSHDQRGYATDEFAGALTVFDTHDYKALTSIALGDPGVVRPMGIASVDGRKLYVTTGRFAALLEVDPQAGRVIRTVDKIGQRPWGLAMSRDGAKAYTANGPSGDVSVIDVASGRLEARIQVGGSPWGAADLPGARTPAVATPGGSRLKALRALRGSCPGPSTRNAAPAPTAHSSAPALCGPGTARPSSLRLCR